MGRHVGNSNEIVEIEILIEVLEDNVNKICQKIGGKCTAEMSVWHHTRQEDHMPCSRSRASLTQGKED